MFFDCMKTHKGNLFALISATQTLTLNTLADIRKNRGVAFYIHLMLQAKLNHGFCQWMLTAHLQTQSQGMDLLII